MKKEIELKDCITFFSPMEIIRLFIPSEKNKSGYERIFEGCSNMIPKEYYNFKIDFITISYKEEVVNIDLK